MVLNKYIVNIEFLVRAEDDDAALHKVTKTLAHDTSYDWVWATTQLITNSKEGEEHVNPNK